MVTGKPQILLKFDWVIVDFTVRSSTEILSDKREIFQTLINIIYKLLVKYSYIKS